MARENEVARELAGFIGAEVDRTNSLITRFLDFARPLPLKREMAELSEVLDGAIAQFERRQPPFDIAVYKNYSPDIRPAPARRRTDATRHSQPARKRGPGQPGRRRHHC